MPVRRDNTEKFLRLLRAAERKAVQAMALRAVQLTQLAVNESAQPTTVKVKRRTKGGNKFTRTIYINPSKPGEPPHKRTGEGQRNIAMQMVSGPARARVGWRPAGKHMFFHEVGISYGGLPQKRSHLVRTVKKNRQKLGLFGVRVFQRSMPQS